MDGTLFLYAGSILPLVWGAAHLFPTKAVVRGFGDLSSDNRRTITMEWILEGVSLIFIGILVAMVTYVDPSNSISRLVYWVSFGFLNAFSIVSLFTGFRNSFVAFRLCPFIFTASSLLILAGCLLV